MRRALPELACHRVGRVDAELARRLGASLRWWPHRARLPRAAHGRPDLQRPTSPEAARVFSPDPPRTCPAQSGSWAVTTARCPTRPRQPDCGQPNTKQQAEHAFTAVTEPAAAHGDGRRQGTLWRLSVEASTGQRLRSSTSQLPGRSGDYSRLARECPPFQGNREALKRLLADCSIEEL